MKKSSIVKLHYYNTITTHVMPKPKKLFGWTINNISVNSYNNLIGPENVTITCGNPMIQIRYFFLLQYYDNLHIIMG